MRKRSDEGDISFSLAGEVDRGYDGKPRAAE